MSRLRDDLKTGCLLKRVSYISVEGVVSIIKVLTVVIAVSRALREVKASVKRGGAVMVTQGPGKSLQ